MIVAGETPPPPVSIVLFDSTCVLCTGHLQFVLKHERGPTTRFVSVNSAEGLAVAQRFGFSAADLDLTFVVVESGVALTRSSAALAMAGHLRAPWRWLGLLRFVPRRWRDAAYDLIARNRYRWFGHRACMVPTAEQRARVILE